MSKFMAMAAAGIVAFYTAGRSEKPQEKSPQLYQKTRELVKESYAIHRALQINPGNIDEYIKDSEKLYQEMLEDDYINCGR